MNRKMLIMAAVALLLSPVSGYSDPVPKQLLKPGAGLELIEGTKHDLLRTFQLGDTSYFVVYQTPEFGPSELVLIRQKSGAEPQFVRGGAWADITRATLKDSTAREQQVPEDAKYAVASALVTREIDSRRAVALREGTDTGKALAALADRINEEAKKGLLDQYFKKAYQDQGLINKP